MKLSLVGNPSECYHFMNDLKTHPEYEVTLESKEYHLNNHYYHQTRLELTLDVKEKERKPLLVHLTTEQGQKIELNLLEGVVVDVGEMTYVSGKVFDILYREKEEIQQLQPKECW